VNEPKSQEVFYRKRLLSLTAALKTDIEKHLFPLLVSLEPQYIADSHVSVINSALLALMSKYNQIDILAGVWASEFVSGVNRSNSDRFYKSVKGAIGIDLNDVVARENLGPILEASTIENVKLIKTIDQRYFSQLQSIVYGNVIQGTRANSMISEIRALGAKSDNWAKVIARDQTSKLNASLSAERATAIGAAEYIWRTSEDGDRVRETHRRNNKKKFRYDTPPPITGHPGNDIQCRCLAQPIIKV